MYFKSIILTFINFLFLVSFLFAQDLTLSIQGTPRIKIEGDSNVRSWDADIKQVEVTLVLQGIPAENRSRSSDGPFISLDQIAPESFKSLIVTIPVESIESGSGGLTRNIHKYLKEKDHPYITFSLKQVTDIKNDSDKTLIKAEGVILAAGKENSVTLQVSATPGPDGSIRFSGEQALRMTHFDIHPPTAVLGTVRAKDEFKVIFDVYFK